MRLRTVLAVSSILIGLAACDSGTASPSAANDPAVTVGKHGVSSVTPSTGHHTTPHLPSSRDRGATPAAGSPGPRASENARAAATQFDSLFFAQQFASSWDHLSPRAKQLVSRSLWVEVHQGCAAHPSGAVSIKAVTVFGDTAIVSESVGAAHTAAYVFAYTNGAWGFSPDDIGTYHHGSPAADVAAAKTEGFCGGWKAF